MGPRHLRAALDVMCFPFYPPLFNIIQDVETKAYRICLDVCCHNRPFDDLPDDRVRIEADAVLAILSRCRNGVWRLFIFGFSEAA